MTRALIVTADDFGLAPEINRGIVESHQRGIVTATSLLMNAPATAEAVELAQEVPDLEVGIHLSLVEGLALSGRESSVTDHERYFDGRLCLLRHWRVFLRKWLRREIRPADLEHELDLQLQAFRDQFPTVPFANGTQHLHLLPGIQDLVLRLCRKYGIRILRIPWRRSPEPMPWSRRIPAEAMLVFGKRMKRKAEALGVATPANFIGFGHSGSMTETVLATILRSLPASGVTEIMVHPGRDCPSLRRDLPWAYRDFHWEAELGAVTGPGVIRFIEANGIRLSTFRAALAHDRSPDASPNRPMRVSRPTHDP